ncbi:hypothetical protein ACFQV2_19840 [Actinokineospora soli]|uniref:Nitroreductase family protein n=1 Tax=Actinokineospora soli TaxID=1048753 RepID=A0ABW2TRM9_9PSEU
MDHDTLVAAIADACRAPSVHNTQPWRWLVGTRSLHLMANRTRWLRATDPRGRDLVMSCGAALDHLRTALAARGWALINRGSTPSTPTTSPRWSCVPPPATPRPSRPRSRSAGPTAAGTPGAPSPPTPSPAW